MRLVFAADLHGDVERYAALGRLAADCGAGAIVLGGDLGPNSREAAPQVDFARGAFRSFLESVRAPVLAIPGNADWPAAVAVVEGLQAAGRIHLLGLTPFRLPGGPALVGYPKVPPKSSRRKDWERRDLAADAVPLQKPCYITTASGEPVPVGADYLDRLPGMEEELTSLGPEAVQAVWVIHAPPHGCGLDRTKRVHAGSRAVRGRIEALQPPLTLHGHIHEGPAVSGRWWERIGRTICVNPGKGEPPHAVVAEVQPDGAVVSLWHSVWGRAALEG